MDAYLLASKNLLAPPPPCSCELYTYIHTYIAPGGVVGWGGRMDLMYLNPLAIYLIEFFSPTSLVCTYIHTVEIQVLMI